MPFLIAINIPGGAANRRFAVGGSAPLFSAAGSAPFPGTPPRFGGP
jgi:hypothetical protein